MLRKITLSILSCFIIMTMFTPLSAETEPVLQFDAASETRLHEVFTILKENNLKSDTEKLELISEYFLETPYVANRLVGSNDKAEELVIALDELDCFTYIDYIEAFKRSKDVDSFIEALKRVRYIDGDVSYLKRKHFFSDWFAENEIMAEDVLKEEQYKDIVDITTVSLNQGAKGVYIPGLEVRERDIYAIPRENITEAVLATLKTGDYIGLATAIPGLDVTHTMIVIQKEDGTYMRNASSMKANMKVVDQKLIDYITNTKSVRGLVAFRSNASFTKIEGNITQNFVDTQGNVLRDPEVATAVYQEEYALTAPVISGYTVTPDSKSARGVMTEDINVTYVYEKNIVNPVGEYELDFSDSSRARMQEVFALLKENNLKSDTEKLELISGYFLETPYVANRLIGSNTMNEKLVIDLDELDCFTYIDYIEAFKRSTDVDSFIAALKRVRYIDGYVNYLNRKHFFSDWFAENEIMAVDVLKEEQYKDIVDITTVSLNQGAKGVYIPGLEVRERDIYAIPRENITEAVLATLKTGDYIGLATAIPGLDVTHTMIVIQKEDGTYMRNASSMKANMKVVDQKLIDYITNTKSVRGLVAFRSNASFTKFTSQMTVSYLDQEGNALIDSDHIDVLYGEHFEIKARELQGYTLVSEPVHKGIAEEDVLTHQFVYKKDIAIVDKEDTSPILPATGVSAAHTRTILSAGITSLLAGVYLVRRKKD